ncbi:type I-F CRISPR-associated endoribonuclease Cas6/Csy4 [Vibrio navarrensis]|nr:type I-F CRISPR-associated endoribonuclease Cas6/Csy4 [Vibrio navarrensis]
MLNKYQEITLLSDEQMDNRFLWEQLYKQLHLALSTFTYKHGRNCIGFGFPQYDQSKQTLGSKLRIFAPSETELKELNIRKYLNSISDYVHCTSEKDVPLACDFEIFASVKRRTSSSAGKLARRRVKRAEKNGITLNYDEVLSNYKEIDKNLNVPYVNLVSNTSGNRFPLAILRLPATGRGDENSYSAYGLSRHSPVPKF